MVPELTYEDSVAARARVAGQLRLLGDRILHDASPASLAEVARTLDDLVALLGPAAATTDFAEHVRRVAVFPDRSEEVEALLHPVEQGLLIGLPPIPASISGDVLEAEVSFGAAYEGAPEAANGAFLAAVMEAAMAMLVRRARGWAVARRITFRFRRPTFLHQPVRLTASVVADHRRLVELECTLHDVEGQLTVVGTGRFARVELSRVADRRDERPRARSEGLEPW